MKTWKPIFWTSMSVKNYHVFTCDGNVLNFFHENETFIIFLNIIFLAWKSMFAIWQIYIEKFFYWKKLFYREKYIWKCKKKIYLIWLISMRNLLNANNCWHKQNLKNCPTRPRINLRCNFRISYGFCLIFLVS